MLNLDPNIVDQETVRLKKRKRLFKISAIPLILLVISAIFFLRTGIYNLVLSFKNNSDTPDTVINVLTDFQLVANLIDPSLAYYNRGTITLLSASSSNDLTLAEADFEESLKNSPPDARLCPICINYAYSLELEGDLALKEKKFNDSIIFYNRSEALLEGENCLDKKENEELLKNAKERLAKKRKDAIDASNNYPGEDGEDGGQTPTVKEISEEELKKIMESHKNTSERSAGIMRFQLAPRGNYSLDPSIPRF